MIEVSVSFAYAGQGHHERRREASRVAAPPSAYGDGNTMGMSSRSCCTWHLRHSRYQPPSGLRRRCQRCLPMRQRQGLAMVASLDRSRAGSVRVTRRVQTRDRPRWRGAAARWGSCRTARPGTPGDSASGALTAGAGRPSGPPGWPTRWVGPPGRSPGTPQLGGHGSSPRGRSQAGWAEAA
jgi:hypothetical protein